MQDVLVVASAAFGKNITVYSLDKDEYLNEVYISACKNPHDQRLCLAKAGKKYYAVLPIHVHELLPFVRDKLIESVHDHPQRSFRRFSKDRRQSNPAKIAYTIPTTMKWSPIDDSTRKASQIAEISHYRFSPSRKGPNSSRIALTAAEAVSNQQLNRISSET